jgi:uncharacterized protein YraI
MSAKITLLAATAVLGLGSAAMAMPAVVTADLALRAGPGPAHPIIATIDRNGIVELEGCIDAGMWCRVSWNGVTGWTYAAYLGQQTQDRIVVLPEARRTIQVPTVVYQEQRASTVPQQAPIIITDPITTPSIGTLKVGTIETPPATVQTYVTTNKIEPIFVEGEPVVGAVLPRSVVVREVPQYQYRYAVVNGRTVLVEPDTNRIVYVYR